MKKAHRCGSTIFGIYITSLEQWLGHYHAMYKRTLKPDVDQWSTIIAFLCKKHVPRPSPTPFTTTSKHTPYFHVLGKDLIYFVQIFNTALAEGLPNTYGPYNKQTIKLSCWTSDFSSAWSITRIIKPRVQKTQFYGCFAFHIKPREHLLQSFCALKFPIDMMLN